MRHWLVKSEPEVYGWSALVADGRTAWTGIRNAQARNNLAEMKVGDRVLYYHSNEGKAVVGVAEVVRESYPDPTADDARWLAVDLAALESLPRPVTLATFKSDPVLQDSLLARHSRLSVLPLTAQHWARVMELARQ